MQRKSSEQSGQSSDHFTDSAMDHFAQLSIAAPQTTSNGVGNDKTIIEGSFGVRKRISKEERRNTRTKQLALTRKVRALEEKVRQLENENQTLNRGCRSCRWTMQTAVGSLSEALRLELERSKTIWEGRKSVSNTPEIGQCGNNDLAAAGAVQCERMHFGVSLLERSEMQQRAWVFLGTLMLAMGSKLMEVDGTFNTFQVEREAVDKLRRQLDKCEEELSLDFFCKREDQEVNDLSPFIQEETHQGQFILDSLRLASVDSKFLTYDEKYTLHVNYDALILLTECLKEHSVLT